jgi:O-antigen/teichoic acid export membrane protein
MSQSLYSKTVIKNLLLALSGTLLTRVITICPIPLFIRVITQEQYGLWYLLTSFIHILTISMSMGLRQFVGIYYFHYTVQERKNLISTIASIYCIVSLPLGSIVLLHYRFINKTFFFNQASGTLLALACICSFLYLFNDLFFQTLKYTLQMRTLTALAFACACVNTATTIFYVFVLKLGLLGLMLGLLSGLLVPFFYAHTIYAKKNSLFTLFIPSKTLILRCLKGGIIFIPGLLSGWLLSSGNRWILGNYMGLKEVGIYSVLETYIQLFDLIIIQSINYSYIPTFLTLLSLSNNKKEIAYTNKKIMFCSMAIGFIILTAVFTFFQPLLYKLLPESYFSALRYSWLMLLGSLFLLGSYFTFAYLQYSKHVTTLALANCLPAFLNIALTMLLVPAYGIYGCVIAYVSAQALCFCMTLIASYNSIEKL